MPFHFVNTRLISKGLVHLSDCSAIVKGQKELVPSCRTNRNAQPTLAQGSGNGRQEDLNLKA